MITLTIGDCIPVRINPKQWAPYFGRVIGFDPINNIVIVINRDKSSKEHKRVKYIVNEQGFNFYLEQAN